MNTPFGSLGISASGMRVFQTWIDAVSDNVANVNTVNPAGEESFRERFVLAQASGGGALGGARSAGVGTTGTGEIGDGVFVAGAAFGDGEGRMVYNPDHPYADADGMVRMPNIDMSTQMTNLIVAQRAYSANVTVFQGARDTYLRALEIGK
jgi:flagellar basal-body rod protein FlgC